MERGEEQQVAHILLHLRRLYRTTVIDTVLELPWMVATGVGTLVVIDEQRLVQGLLTTRDLRFAD